LAPPFGYHRRRRMARFPIPLETFCQRLRPCKSWCQPVDGKQHFGPPCVRAYLCFGQVEELPLRKIRQIRIINCKAFEIRMGARVELRTTFACGILIVCPRGVGGIQWRWRRWRCLFHVVVAICERNRGWVEKGWRRVGITPFLINTANTFAHNSPASLPGHTQN